MPFYYSEELLEVSNSKIRKIFENLTPFIVFIGIYSSFCSSSTLFRSEINNNAKFKPKLKNLFWLKLSNIPIPNIMPGAADKKEKYYYFKEGFENLG